MTNMQPAVAFATTYYYNFVKLVCDVIADGGEIELGQDILREADTQQVRLQIIMQDDLQTSSKDSAVELANQLGLRQAAIHCPDRIRTVLALPNSPVLVDIPTILDTLRHIYPPSLPEPERARLEAEAITDFRQEITNLVTMDEVCRRYAAIQSWEWWQSQDVTSS